MCCIEKHGKNACAGPQCALFQYFQKLNGHAHFPRGNVYGNPPLHCGTEKARNLNEKWRQPRTALQTAQVFVDLSVQSLSDLPKSI